MTELATIGLLTAVSIVWALAGIALGYRLGTVRARRRHTAEQLAARVQARTHREQLASQRQDKTARHWQTPDWSTD